MLKVLVSGTLIRVQSWDLKEAAPAQAEEVLGIAWPKLAGTLASAQADVLCLGPADWLVVAAEPNAATLLQTLTLAFERRSFRATDVSDAWVRVQIEGPHARAVLSKACALDLHPYAFPAGRCVRTRLAGMPVIVRCAQESQFQCIVALSYRDYLLSWLTDAQLEFSPRTIQARATDAAQS